MVKQHCTVNQKGHQKGVALLSVLLTMSIAVILVATMTDNFRFRLRSTTSMQNMEQAWWYALSGEELAMKALMQDLSDDPDVTHLNQYWATDHMSFPIGSGTITGQVVDARACFNLNTLEQEDSESGEKSRNLRVFQSLLENHNLERYQAEQISEASRDWVHSDTTPVSGRGAGDDHYMSMPVPYMAANTQMRDPTELRAVLGVHANIARRLLPDLCAIPDMDLSVNVNTIREDQPELIAALFMGEMSVSQAENLLKSRPRDGWQTVDEFMQNPVLANVNTTRARGIVSVHSDYFELNARVEANGAAINLRSLLWRKGEKEVVVVRRRPGEQT